MLSIKRSINGLLLFAILLCACAAFGQAPKPKKIFMVTDMEGVSGIRNRERCCRSRAQEPQPDDETRETHER